jgi:Fe-S cluster assembly iron-binding protein IscA
MDKTRIWFNVKNAAPELKNLTLTYPQYADNGSFTLNNGTDKTMFDCT